MEDWVSQPERGTGCDCEFACAGEPDFALEDCGGVRFDALKERGVGAGEAGEGAAAGGGDERVGRGRRELR